MRTTSRKLKKLIEEEEKTLARIEEQQEYLKKIQDARKQEEDLVIIRSIRSMKLHASELLDLLTSIQEGNLSTELREQLLEGPMTSDDEAEDAENHGENTDPDNPGDRPEAGGTGKQRKADGDYPVINGGAVTAPEREENDDAE